jgi:hypothetical protein
LQRFQQLRFGLTPLVRKILYHSPENGPAGVAAPDVIQQRIALTFGLQAGRQ